MPSPFSAILSTKWTPEPWQSRAYQKNTHYPIEKLPLSNGIVVNLYSVYFTRTARDWARLASHALSGKTARAEIARAVCCSTKV